MAGGTKSYESTVMRMAGNIAGTLIALGQEDEDEDVYATFEDVAEDAVKYARAIVAEVLRTEPRVD